MAVQASILCGRVQAVEQLESASMDRTIRHEAAEQNCAKQDDFATQELSGQAQVANHISLACIVKKGGGWNRTDCKHKMQSPRVVIIPFACGCRLPYE